MTRKDYKLIARILLWGKPNRVLPSDQAIQLSKWESICTRFAYELARDNPRFDRTKFLEACGL